jgi:hypothetical protein
MTVCRNCAATILSLSFVTLSSFFSSYFPRNVQKSLNCNVRNNFCCSSWLLKFNISELSDPHTFVDRQNNFMYHGCYEIHEGYVLIVFTIPLLLLWRQEWGNKLIWTRTHACKSNINNSGIVSPSGTFLYWPFIIRRAFGRMRVGWIDRLTLFY